MSVYRVHHGFDFQNFLSRHFFCEFSDIFRGRMQHNIGWCVQLFNHPVLHNCDPIRKAQCLVKIMGNEQDGLVQHPLKSQKFILHFLADQRVKRREWLIKEPDIRLNR